MRNSHPGPGRGTVVGVALLLASLLAGGCNRPKPASLRGKVLCDGKPLAEGNLCLWELQPGIGDGAGTQIVAGRYSIASGLFAGHYRIGVISFRRTGRTFPVVRNDVGLEGMRKAGYDPPPGTVIQPTPPHAPIEQTVQFLPECYNTRSELEVVLQPGENEHDLELHAPAEKPSTPAKP